MIRNPVLPDNLQQMQSESGTPFFSALISTFVTILLVVGAIYFVFMFLTAGIDWIRAGSDKQQLEAARSRLVNATVGLVLLFSAWAVFSLVEAVFGVDILNLSLPAITGL